MSDEKKESSVFSRDRTGATGTAEWSERSLNIGLGCAHDCRYCYARTNALRYKQIEDGGQWTVERLNKRASTGKVARSPGVTMFPTTHDITPFYLEHYLRVARLALQSGNSLLIVSKPHLDCTERLCAELAEFREQILLRFTIGTLDPKLAAFWEPGAPPPEERLAALRHAFGAGFATSVSSEPMLGGVEDTVALYEAVAPFCTDKVWIGKMNKVRERVALDSPEVEAAAKAIEAAQSDAEVLRLTELLAGADKVAWKDSILQVLARAKPREPRS